MRIHGLLTVLAILIIAAGFVPQYMGEIGSMTGEHTGVMLADELGTIGDDFNLSFKDGLVESTLIMEYYDGTDYITVTDETAQQFYTYYLLNNDSSQKLYLDGSFEDGKFTDLSGNGNHGIPYNGATTGTGVVGDGMSFDASSSQYLDCGNDVSLNAPDEVSISAWVKMIIVTSNKFLVSKRTAWSTPSGYWLLFDYVTLDGWEVRGRGYNRARFINSSSQVDTWYHIVGTLNDDGTKNKLYVNGVESQNSVTATELLENNDLPVLIGSLMDGTLDEIRIYDRAISPDEVEVLNDVPLQMQSWNGYDLYASYEYRDTFAPIATDLFTIGFPVLGIVILVFVGASYLYNN